MFAKDRRILFFEGIAINMECSSPMRVCEVIFVVVLVRQGGAMGKMNGALGVFWPGRICVGQMADSGGVGEGAAAGVRRCGWPGGLVGGLVCWRREVRGEGHGGGVGGWAGQCVASVAVYNMLNLTL